MLKLAALSFALLASAQAYAADWHSVLVCDGGAAVVDNSSRSLRGDSEFDLQLVIRDQNIINYFNAHALSDTRFSEKELVAGASVGTCSQKTNPQCKFFDASLTSTQFASSNVKAHTHFDGTGLDVQITDASTGNSANWYFRSCEVK